MDADGIIVTQPDGVELSLHRVEVREPEPWEDLDNNPSWPAMCGCGADISNDLVLLPIGWPVSIPDGIYAAWIVDNYMGIIVSGGLIDCPVLALCRSCMDETAIVALIRETGGR